jgi:hypothetical protein
MASCPSNVPILQAIQVSHPSLPNGDLFFVDRLKPYTLGLEDGSSLSECGLDPGAPGMEPTDPGSPPASPGDEPPSPGNEPILSSYTYVVDGVSYSQRPFDLNYREPEDEPIAFEVWESTWDTWQTDIGDAGYLLAAREAAEVVFDSDHAWWVALKATYDAWVAATAAYAEWEAATAIYVAWEARDDAYTAWLACVAAETITQVFQPLAFEIKLSATGEHGIQDLSITGCDVEGQFGDFIESVALSGSNDPIILTYRAYREDDLNTVQYLLPMSLSRTRVTVYSFSANASVGDLVNRAYLTESFTKQRFPGLESRG